MGKEWDHHKGGRDQWVAWLKDVMTEARRIIKPGGHALVWALPRTSHWTATALEDAGWEIRDKVTHIFSTGFPKSHDISKALDRMAGAERERVCPVAIPRRVQQGTNALGGSWQTDPYITAPATPAAAAWDGWGTALKPACEDWILCRAPLAEPTVAANVLTYGTGALNVAACRVGTESTLRSAGVGGSTRTTYGSFAADTEGNRQTFGSDAGRWPTNLVFSHDPACTLTTCAEGCAVAELGRQSGITDSRSGDGPGQSVSMFGMTKRIGQVGIGDTGTAARFFPAFRYQAKPSRAERNRGLHGHASTNVTLRDDLTPEQRAYVISELLAAGVRL